MAQQTTASDRLTAPWNAKVRIKISGCTSPTDLQLARNINKVHTLQTDFPIGEVPNNYTRRKSTFGNSPALAQYELQLQPMVYDGQYEWELHIKLARGAGGADNEELVFTSTPQSTKLDPTAEVTEWTRGFTPADTNLNVGSISFNERPASPVAGRPRIESFEPEHRSVLFGGATLRWNMETFDEPYDRYEVSVWNATTGELIEYDDNVTDEEYTIGAVAGSGFDSGFDTGFGGSGEPVEGDYWWRVAGYYGAQEVLDEYEMNKATLVESSGFDSGFQANAFSGTAGFVGEPGGPYGPVYVDASDVPFETGSGLVV